MKRGIVALAALTTISMLSATLAVVKYSVSFITAFLPVLGIFVVLSGIFVWRKSKHEFTRPTSQSDKSRTALKWFSIPFLISPIAALVMAQREGWNAGDTIGAIFFCLFVLVIAYQLLRRRGAPQPR